MKIKPIKHKGIYEESRYNINTNGVPVKVESGVLDSDKKDYAVLSLYSLMYECGFISEYLSENKERDLIEKVSNSSQEFVDNYSSDGGMEL